MNILKQSVGLALALCAFSVQAEPVRLQLNSFSLQFATARSRIFGIDYINQVTSEGSNPPNGELQLAPQGASTTHQVHFCISRRADVRGL